MKKIKELYIHQIIGIALSCLSFLFILIVGLEAQWTKDEINYVYYSPYKMIGIDGNDGLRVKLSNMKVDILGYDITDSSLRPTTYVDYCSITEMMNEDPWCSSLTLLSGFLISFAILTGIASFVASILATLQIKIPTWDGEGRDFTISIGIVFQFFQVVFCISTVILWYFIHQKINAYCTDPPAGKICPTISTTFYNGIASSFIGLITLIFWRIVNRWQLSHSSGKTKDNFISAAKEENIDVLLEYVANNKIDIVDVNGSDGRNALHWACALNKSTVCHILLKKGASISKKDVDGWTPLHWASRMGNEDIVRMLAKYGADVNARDKWGVTPLMLCVVGGSLEAFLALIELGADLNAKNVYGQTCLMLCTEEGKRKRAFIIQLCNAGVALNKKDSQGMNALHYAASEGDVYMLDTMLTSGDDLCKYDTNKFSDTPADEALLRNNVDAWKRLTGQSSMAKTFVEVKSDSDTESESSESISSHSESD